MPRSDERPPTGSSRAEGGTRTTAGRTENFIYADGNPYIGPNAVLEGVFMRLGSEWSDFSVSPSEVLDSGDTIIGHGYYSGTCRKTGKSVRAQFAHLFTIRGGKVVKFQQYTDTAQFARAVAG